MPDLIEVRVSEQRLADQPAERPVGKIAPAWAPGETRCTSPNKWDQNTDLRRFAQSSRNGWDREDLVGHFTNRPPPRFGQRPVDRFYDNGGWSDLYVTYGLEHWSGWRDSNPRPLTPSPLSAFFQRMAARGKPCPDSPKH